MSWAHTRFRTGCRSTCRGDRLLFTAPDKGLGVVKGTRASVVEQLDETEHPIELNRARLNLWPDALGIQHDERRALLDAPWQALLPRKWRKTWPREARSINPQAELHPSVLERSRATSVRNYDRHEPYRPNALENHEKLLATWSMPEPQAKPTSPETPGADAA